MSRLLPTEATCKILKPETNIDPVYSVVFAKKEIRSPFRTALLKVQNTTTNKDSIALQGTDLTAVWSALIDLKTGALTVALADKLRSLCGLRSVQGRRREITLREFNLLFFKGLARLIEVVSSQ